MSHQIDFRSHGNAREWNGHWGYSDTLWTLIRGKRRWLINRQPCSVHKSLLEKNGFELTVEKRDALVSKLRRSDLAPRFSEMPELDLTTSSAFLQSVLRRPH